MNDNYFPLRQIVLTEKEKVHFLEKELPSLVEIDPGVKEIVDCVNNLPLFLTQSSCEGQTDFTPLSSHLPVPYITIGVLYNEFPLLHKLADHLGETMNGKFKSISISSEVQAINKAKSKLEVPNYQEYLTVYFKSKRHFSLFKEALSSFEACAPKDKNVPALEEETEDYFNRLLLLLNQLDRHESNKLKGISNLVEELKYSPSLSHVSLRKQNEFLTVEFYVNDEAVNLRDLFRLLTSFFTGDVIANIHYQKTSSGKYLKKAVISLVNPEKSDVFEMITRHWIQVGEWSSSPYWIKE